MQGPSTGGQKTQNPPAQCQQKLILESRMRNGIHWFYWIAVLSLVNPFLHVGPLKLALGLGVTQFVDRFAATLVGAIQPGGDFRVRMAGYALNAGIAGIFFAAGALGGKGYRWAVITGMILYGSDGSIFPLAGEWPSLAFHAFALWYLWTGLKASFDLDRLEAGEAIIIPPAVLSDHQAFPRGLSRTSTVLLIIILVGIIVPLIISGIWRPR